MFAAGDRPFLIDCPAVSMTPVVVSAIKILEVQVKFNQIVRGVFETIMLASFVPLVYYTYI